MNTNRTTFITSGGLTSLLLTAQIFLAAAAVILAPVQAMRSAVCDTQCDFVAADAALYGVMIAAIAILLLNAVALFVRRKKWSENWPIVLGGIVLTILAMVISNQIFIAAFPPLPAS